LNENAPNMPLSAQFCSFANAQKSQRATAKPPQVAFR